MATGSDIDFKQLFAFPEMVEFQARPEKFMALRMNSYACLLCEDLIQQRRTTHGRLPLLLPIVLYSGRSPWSAATSLAQLRPQMDPYLETLQPDLKYHLVDRHNASPLMRAILEIEQADERTFQIVPQLATIAIWARRQHNPDLSRTIARWVKRQLGTTFDMQGLPPECSLEEMYMMFEHKFRDFEHLLEFQAIERGLAQGRAQGKTEAQLAERRRILRLLIEHRGVPVFGKLPERIDQASSEQLAEWIEIMIAGGLPHELEDH